MDDGRRARTERLVRWSVTNPIGWLLFQFAQVIVAAGLVRLVAVVFGDRVSSSQLWGLFAVIVFALAILNYRLRKRVLADTGSSSSGDR